jgi:hypothetical protein
VADAIDQMLRQLQGAARSAGDEDDQTLSVKLAMAYRGVTNDPRYADIDSVEDELLAFAQQCRIDRRTNQVPVFRLGLDKLAQGVRDITVVFGLRDITIDAPVRIGDVEFCTLPRWPAVTASQDMPRAAARTAGRGTDVHAVAQRCRIKVHDALRRLRIVAAGNAALRQTLLFGLDGDWAVADGSAHGWARPSDKPVPLDLNKVASLLASTDAAVLRLPTRSMTAAQQQAQFALLWLDKAAQSADPMDRSILSIFALEALLGDKAEGLKAQSLVFYRVMLGRVVSGWLPDPGTIYTFYAKVRSYAVHGSIPTVTPSDEDVDFLATDARCALDEYLRLCEDKGFSKRAQVKEHLRSHPTKHEVLSWLRELDPETWTNWEPGGDT